MESESYYEIRLELLKLAQSIVFENNMSKCQTLQNDWNTLRDVAMANGNNPPPHPVLPTITAEAVIAEATKFGNFVFDGE